MRLRLSAVAAAAATSATAALTHLVDAQTQEVPKHSTFGYTASGAPITLRTIENGCLRVQVMDFGATITSVLVPDRRGTAGEVTLGFDDAKPYVDGQSPYFGCVAGRVANRIASGKFKLFGKEYSLATNNGPNHLHGGNVGFDKKLWTCEAHTPTSITLALFSPDGEEGYPANLLARVTYSLPSSSQLKMEYTAASDDVTPVNLTNHTYWNLADGGQTPCTTHTISIEADFYTPVDDTSIPTGEIRCVDASSGAMDLRQTISIGAKLADADQGMGYDHNYVLRAAATDGMREVATVSDPSSGRTMRVRSDQPGVQFYTGNYLNGIVGRGGVVYGRHHGFCLETQRFPDSVNRAHFPDSLLRPGNKYTHTTTHDFGVY
ncbi:hypothetical protein AB1Y20_010076 [Prymnesium parvum]|uniref:Aldose 1-epimerase n=1 Tax=Prymnesium parvum TaxID=97485 RepID=A0AB34K8D9_PRYPA